MSTSSLLRNAFKVFNKYPFRNNFHQLCYVPIEKYNLAGMNATVLHKRYNQTKAIKCWKCGIEKQHISELFCEKCNIIQKPEQTENYFKIFNFEETFNIDQKLLTQKFRQMQSLLHPDKFSNKSKQEKAISEDFSALVNKAYNILQTPLNRAIHLLHLHGESIEENQKVEDPEFLMEIMELNEEVEEANTAEKLRGLNIKNKNVLDKISKSIDNAFLNNKIPEAKELIIKMKYYTSINTHINGILRERGIVD